MTQSYPIAPRDAASPRTVSLAHKVKEIASEVDAYDRASGEIFLYRQELDNRIVAGKASQQSAPSLEDLRELIALQAEATAIDTLAIRYCTRDEFFKDFLPQRRPEFRKVANEFCQSVVDDLYPLRVESEKIDAEAARSLGIERVVSVRTSSLARVIEIAMRGDWSAAMHLSGVILDEQSSTPFPTVVP